MLVLSRKLQEAVVVAAPDASEHTLKVTVLEVSHGRVRLGFEADAGVIIHRWEVWQRIRAGAPRESPPRAAAAPGVA